MKKLTLPAMCFCLAGLILPGVRAQDPPMRDPLALQIATLSFAAMGAGSLVAVEDTVAEGSITWADGTTGTIRLKTKGADRIRTEVVTGGSQIVTVAGVGGGHTSRDGVEHTIPRWTTTYQRALHIPALSRLSDIARPRSAILYLGLEEVGGRPAHHIRLYASPSDETPLELEEMLSDFHLFIDAQTYVVVKALSYDFSPEIIENRSLVATYFGDYREVGGLLVPFHTERYLYGQKQMEVNLISVRLNVGLPEGDFR